MSLDDCTIDGTPTAARKGPAGAVTVTTRWACRPNLYHNVTGAHAVVVEVFQPSRQSASVVRAEGPRSSGDDGDAAQGLMEPSATSLSCMCLIAGCILILRVRCAVCGAD